MAGQAVEIEHGGYRQHKAAHCADGGWSDGVMMARVSSGHIRRESVPAVCFCVSAFGSLVWKR